MTVALRQYTVAEVCNLLKVSRSTLERQIRRRLLKVVRIGRSVRIRETELQAFLDRRQR